MNKNIISLFDGIGVGLLALINIGYEDFTYHRVEIDKHANNAFREFWLKNLSLIENKKIRIIEHKDVRNFPDKDNEEMIKRDGVFLLMGGSPCTSVSIAGKQEGLVEGAESSLFYEYIRIKELFQPKYFLLENVKMKKDFLDEFNLYMGCEGVLINSADFSAQDRKRFYWSNINYDKEWGISNLTVEDILEEKVDDKYFIEPRRAIEICDNEFKKRKIGYIGKDSIGNRIYTIHGKSVTLMANGGGCGAKTGLYSIPCLTPDRVDKRQNGRRFKPPESKFYTLTTMDKHGVLIGNYIRKLTPVECERLQGWPDNLTEGAISDSQRYKICGNGWTLPVIQHILNGLFK